MKANELMIGDWVEPNQCMIPTVYCKVEGIYPDGTVNLDKAERLFTLDEIEPVPLTEEIIEKNEIDTVFKTRYKGFYLEYHAETGMIMLYVYNNGSFQTTGIGFKYVHELQHALRLCGIDKTIKL